MGFDDSVLICDEVDPVLNKILQDNGLKVSYEPKITPDQIKEKISNFNIVIVRSRTTLTKEMIEKADKCKIIARVGVGLDNVDQVAAKEKNIRVINAAEGAMNAVAELVLGLMLSLARQTARGDRAIRNGQWLKNELKGTELRGKYLGIVGLGKNRRLVPTRWSITATDDILGKHLYKQILDNSVGEIQAYFGSYLGNYYLILFLGSCWSYELFEIALPGVYDAIGGVSTDYEGVFGRKDYAEQCAGGYYTVRLAILEKLAELKQQTSALVFRFITNEYTMPLGVWVTREAARKALRSKPITFATKELALTYTKHLVRRKFGYYVELLFNQSILLRSGRQKNLNMASPASGFQHAQNP
ncbi:MAG: hypothetical protein HYT44_03970 [Nitrosarchaeum sp.]|nr:hypothetical protein [Nitrosarchaeum sp.]